MEQIYLYVGYYLIGINLLALLMYGLDKLKSKKQSNHRTPEALLLIVALIGGSVGALLGMYIFRHKTQHPQFALGLPSIFVLQLIFLLWWLFKV